MNQKIIEVVGGIIRRGDKYLLGRRPVGKSLGGHWEFIGGKIEPGENPEQALARECREEIALDMLREEQDISRRDLSIYLALQMRGESAKVVGVRHSVSSNNAAVIKFRIGRLLRKYGPRCFERALQKVQAELCMAVAA